MFALLGRYWWVIALRGAVAILFGILTFAWPQLTLVTLILLFGAYALVDGVFNVIAGLVTLGRRERWWGLLLHGIVGLAIGIITLARPGATALALLTVIAAWSIVTGVSEIVAGIQLRRQIDIEWLLILGGLLSIVFGGVLLLFPGPGALGLLWLIAAYAVLFGLLSVILAFRVRRLSRQVEVTAASQL